MTDASCSLPEPAPELSIYRDHCIALLRRYFHMSVEVGRLPALLGRECFRAQAHDYHVHSFERLVVFVIDVERCLDRLHPFDKQLIALIALQEYTQEEAASLLGYSDRQIRNRFPRAIDALTAILLEKKLFTPFTPVRRRPQPDHATPRSVTISCCADPQAASLLAGSAAASQLVPASLELA